MLSKSRGSMSQGLPHEALQQVLSQGSTPYEADVLAEVLNLEISAFDLPHGTRPRTNRHHSAASPPSGAPGGGAPSAHRAAPSGRPLPSPSARPMSPSGRTASPSGRLTPSSLAPVQPFHRATILPSRIPEGYKTFTTQCGIDRQEQQICAQGDAFCFSSNFHCCAPGSEPEFCPGKVTTQPAAPTRSELAVACLRDKAACNSGDQESCVLSTPVCGAARTSLRT